MLLDARRVFGLSARAYDEMTRQPIWRAQVRKLLSFLPPAASAPSADHGASERDLLVLDVGCGPGTSTLALAEGLPFGARFIGVDIAPSMVAIAQRRLARGPSAAGRVSFVVADATSLPLPSASVDLITGHSFLYLVSDRAAVLRELARVLRPGGTLALMEPNAGGSLLAAIRQVSPFSFLSISFVEPVSTARFTASIVAWRLFSGLKGRIDPAQITALFAEAGLPACSVSPTLAGLGLHCVARR